MDAMTAPLGPSPQCPPRPAPWEWFEFLEPSRPVRAACHPWREPASDSATRVWHVAVDGQRIAFKVLRADLWGGPRVPHGRRPVLILLHGMGLTIASFRGIAPWLAATHDLILPDYSAMMSADPRGEAGIKVMGAAVWRIADALGVPRVSLAGSSLGGGLCLIAALLRPRHVARIVLSNPACFPQDLPGMYRLARVPIVGEVLMAVTRPDKLVDGLEHLAYADKARFDPALRRIYTDTLATLRGRWRLMDLIRQLPANAADTADAPHLRRLGELRQPVLVCWGLRDPLLVPGAGARLAAALPNAQYQAYEDLAHQPHEEDPQRIGRRWAEFLNESAGAPGAGV